MEKDYEKCKRYTGDNICDIAHPHISYCDVNRNNLQCPESMKPSKDIEDSERNNQILIELKLRIGIRMLERIERILTTKAGHYEDVNEFIIDSIRHSFSDIDNK